RVDGEVLTYTVPSHSGDAKLVVDHAPEPHLVTSDDLSPEARLVLGYFLDDLAAEQWRIISGLYPTSGTTTIRSVGGPQVSALSGQAAALTPEGVKAQREKLQELIDKAKEGGDGWKVSITSNPSSALGGHRVGHVFVTVTAPDGTSQTAG